MRVPFYPDFDARHTFDPVELQARREIGIMESVEEIDKKEVEEAKAELESYLSGDRIELTIRVIPEDAWALIGKEIGKLIMLQNALPVHKEEHTPEERMAVLSWSEMKNDVYALATRWALVGWNLLDHSGNPCDVPMERDRIRYRDHDVASWRAVDAVIRNGWIDVCVDQIIAHQKLSPEDKKK